ncbi:GntR family transcriptional regulator [Nocardioides sp. KC13]|uniref:GntR family transcriptional regulator n=1 Tax=Nocardioides turkmenicus TaxID=2711220 RepID=A0A6M1QVH6_9ACTN|nr:GntR family transcriptional regulator [Nocardioides sp. KC13]NGN91322.1 GntR family transcriptional regulator [Nocardioides sp. KC13]
MTVSVHITNLQQLEKVSLRERVSRALRAAIVSGELEPGEVYSAPALGAKFGVSATPVREAMLDLVRENLVTTVPNKGYRITTVGEADLDDITELRMLIEPPLAAKVTAEIPAEDMPKLRDLARAIVDGALAGDLVAYTDADHAFHLQLLAYVGNARVSALIADLRAHTRLYGLSSLDGSELEESAREHDLILDAIEANDPQEVERLMQAHISQTRGRWARPEGS